MFEKIKEKRRERIIKEFFAEGLRIPSRDRLRNTRLPHFVRGDYTLRNSELLFAAISRISNALAAMPIQLYQGVTPKYNDLNDMMAQSPNPNITSTQFFKTMEVCRCAYGNAYALKVLDYDGTLKRLDILDPNRVTPIMNTDEMELWYRITPENGKEFYVHNWYMVHIPFISANGYIGISPVSVLNQTMKYADAIQEFSVKQLEQGVNTSIVLEAPANLGEAQKKQMIESFMNTYRETSGNVLLLESGVVAKNLNLSPVDTKLFEVEKITRSKVAMVYNLPPHLLGDYSSVSYTSQEQQMLEFLTLTMQPIVTAYEQELNRKLLTASQRKARMRFAFNIESALRADAATRAEVDYKAVRSAWKTPDEIRASYNLPPFPSKIGNKPMISQDLATLDYTVNTKPKVLAANIMPNSSESDNDKNNE